MENEKDKIINVAVEDILPNRFQPRLAFDDKELTELSNSIIKYGVIQPIVLRKIGDKYEIIAGERRYKATVLAGLKTIPAILNNTDDNTSAEIALLENLQRKNLTVIEEAQSFKKLLDRGFTQDEIATKLGISQSSIANKIRLLNLPRKVQDALLYNKISERHARSLLSLNNSIEQLDLLDKIINNKLTVRQTEEEISKLLNKQELEENIPDEIKRFIDEPEKETNINQNINEHYNNYTGNYIQSIPDVVNIEMEDNRDINSFSEINDEKGINPFQIEFQNNISKIDDEIKNKEESFYDNIINNDMNKNNFKFIQNNNEDELEDLSDLSTINKSLDLPKTINRVRNFIKDLGNKDSIQMQELDLPDKYQIIIEINKD